MMNMNKNAYTTMVSFETNNQSDGPNLNDNDEKKFFNLII